MLVSVDNGRGAEAVAVRVVKTVEKQVQNSFYSADTITITKSTGQFAGVSTVNTRENVSCMCFSSLT